MVITLMKSSISSGPVDIENHLMQLGLIYPVPVISFLGKTMIDISVGPITDLL